MVGQQVLVLFIGVRIPIPEQDQQINKLRNQEIKKLTKSAYADFFFKFF